MVLNIQYKEYECFQTKNEWDHVIMTALRRIESTNVGSILISELNKLGHTINILNYSSSKSFQYPHFNCINNTIVIPDTPYFVKVEVFNQELIEDVQDEIFDKIINCQPLDGKLDKELCSSFSIFKFQPIVVVLFHELVHCLRYLYNMNTNSQLEEESTIYGTVGNTLIINSVIFTENSFRKELGFGSRISHESKDIYVYNTRIDKNTFSKEYLKALFLKDDFK
jgi:hypothetical protein